MTQPTAEAEALAAAERKNLSGPIAAFWVDGYLTGRRVEAERRDAVIEAARAVALLDELHYSAEPCVDDLIAALDSLSRI